LKIHLHNFGGYEFAFQLSSLLQESGMKVIHTFSDQYKENRDPGSTQADITTTIGIKTIFKLKKYNIFRRSLFEIEFGLRLRSLHNRIGSDILIVSTAPLIVSLILVFGNRSKIIFWHQDIYSTGMALELRKLGPVGTILSKFFTNLEVRILNRADVIVSISKDFGTFYRAHLISPNKVLYHQNWAPTRKVDQLNNATILEGAPLKLLYSGTIGRKHPVGLLQELSVALRNLGVDFSLDIYTSGAVEFHDPNVKIAPPLEYQKYLEELKASNVGLVILNDDASRYSFPSKIYTYLATSIPLVVFAAPGTFIWNVVEEAGGQIFEPNSAGVIDASNFLESLDSKRVEEMKNRSQIFSETNFSETKQLWFWKPLIQNLSRIE
jgi:colanic acid biosynthesis glycosyl transferase WcaI